MKSPEIVTFYISPKVDRLIASRSKQLGLTRDKYIESLVVCECSKLEDLGEKSSKPEIRER